jgi:hypothetical protein
MTRHAERALLAALALIGAYYLVWPLYRAFFFLEILPNEGWNAYHQDAAARGAELYPRIESLILNNYPPLSFYAIGWLGALLGDPLYVGRALSVAALAGLAVAVALVLRQLRCGWAAAALGALWLVAAMGQGFHRFIGANEPQFAAQCAMTFALAWFLARERGHKALEPPILLMAAAGFWKHNVAVVPLVTLTWLWWRDSRRAVRPTLVGIGAVAVGLALCVAVHKQPFIANLLLPRHYSWSKILDGVGKLQWIAPALAVWAVWAWQCRTLALARFTGLYVGIALVTYLVQFGGDGVVDNAQFDLVVASAVALGVAYEGFAATGIAKRWGNDRAKAAIVAALLVRLLANGRFESAAILFDPDYRARFHAHAAIAQDEVDKIAAMPGPVACRNKLICRAAGKPFVADDFKIRQVAAAPRLSEDDVETLLRRHGIAYYRNDPRTVSDSLTRDIFAAWRSGT